MINENDPYATPQSEIREPAVNAIEVPEEITRHIRYGWIAAVVSGTLTLAMTLIVILGQSEDALLGIWNFVDVVLIFGLALGIYRSSRIAATLMFGYFLLSKILIMMETGKPDGLVLSIVFLIFYFRAMLSTFRFHSFIDHARRFPPPPRQRVSNDPLFQPKPPAGNPER
ncbi:hypothetical protein [Pseudoxanthomonas wuyuanensis]